MKRRARAAKRFETPAVLDYGDHGLGHARHDPERSGMIELTDHIRWVPEVGEGWRAPIDQVVVTSKRPALGYLFDGVQIELPQYGPMRLRAMNFPPDVPVPPTQGGTGDARATARLRKELMRRGATERPEQDETPCPDDLGL